MTLDIEAEFARINKEKAEKEAAEAEKAKEQRKSRGCKRCGKPLNGAAHYRGADGPFCWDHSGLYGDRR